jgi:hypothetical protein
MPDWTEDLRYAARMLRKRLGFAAGTVVTLALGIGATTAIFSVVNGVLIKPLPYPDSDPLVGIVHLIGGIDQPYFSDSNGGRIIVMGDGMVSLYMTSWGRR